MVEHVGGFGASLDSGAFANGEVLRQGKIHDEAAGTDDGVSAGVTVCSGSRDGEGSGVEPVAEAAVANLNRLAVIAGAQGAVGSPCYVGGIAEHACGEGRTGGQGERALEEPVAENFLRDGWFGEPAAAFAPG